MKKILYTSLILLSVAFAWSGCKDDDYLNGFGNYEGGSISLSIPIYDLRNLYKGSDVTLTKEGMFGSIGISGVVVSDHTEKNFTDLSGLVFVQDKKRLNSLRGIAINVGAAEAAKWLMGDSVLINLEGAVLTKVNGMLQVNNVTGDKIERKMSNKPIPSNGVLAANILADPAKYEGTLVSIVEGTYNPLLTLGTTLSGDKVLNDGSDNVKLRTLATATFANMVAPFSANYTGVLINVPDPTSGKLVPQVRLRKQIDVEELAATSSVPEMVITGWHNDPAGPDTNNEYIQFRATKDINFSETPFSVVTSNNAGASTPTSYPVTGWALGDLRTYKFNLTSGTVLKGEYFYVGGSNKLINSTSSTSIASAKWIRSFNVSTTNGDGFGTKTGNLLANSGNSYAVAVFRGTTVDVTSAPIDVIFAGTGTNGLIVQLSPTPIGYKIGKTDWYNPINPLEKKNPALFSQPFFRQGTNGKSFAYYPTSDAGMWNRFGGGVFDTNLGKWTKARVQTFIPLAKTSPIDMIEKEVLFKIVNGSGVEIRTDTIKPTIIK